MRPFAWASESPIISTYSVRSSSSATSTWKSQVLPTMQTVRALVCRMAFRPGSLAALRPARRVMPKATNFAFWNVGRIGEEAVVGRVGARPAALDVVDAQEVELARNRRLVGDGEIDALGLGAVSQGGVEEIEAVGRSHGRRHHSGAKTREVRLMTTPTTISQLRSTLLQVPWRRHAAGGRHPVRAARATSTCWRSRPRAASPA